MKFCVTVDVTRVIRRTFTVEAEDNKQAANNVFVEMDYDNGDMNFKVVEVTELQKEGAKLTKDAESRMCL